MVFHFLCQSIAKGNASRTFSRLLMGRYEGSIQRELEKKGRDLLGNARLDLRASGYGYQNYFQEHN